MTSHAVPIPTLRPEGHSRIVRRSVLAIGLLGCLILPPGPAPCPAATPAPWTPLFPNEGPVAGWIVRSWNDVSLPAPPNALWTVSNGTLLGSVPRGTWLVSTRDYADFILDFEFRLGDRGQGGVGLRFPMSGDPAFEGLEVQMVDPRYYGTNHTGQPWEYSGALYKAVAPTLDAYKPLDWNQYTIECRGPLISVSLNGKKVVDVDLANSTAVPLRGKPLAQRPRRGRLGFQEVSRGLGRVEIRNARIQVLDGPG